MCWHHILCSETQNCSFPKVEGSTSAEPVCSEIWPSRALEVEAPHLCGRSRHTTAKGRSSGRALRPWDCGHPNHPDFPHSQPWEMDFVLPATEVSSQLFRRGHLSLYLHAEGSPRTYSRMPNTVPPLCFCIKRVFSLISQVWKHPLKSWSPRESARSSFHLLESDSSPTFLQELCFNFFKCKQNAWKGRKSHRDEANEGTNQHCFHFGCG